MTFYKVMLLAFAVLSAIAAIDNTNKSAGTIYCVSCILYLLTTVAEHFNYIG